MSLDFSKLNFITSRNSGIKYFAYSVEEGKVDDSQLKEIFDKIKSKKYTEKEAKRVVKNIILASYIVPDQRTDYQFLSSEALLHVLSFIDIKGSANLKILYCLCPYIVKIEKENNKENYYLYKGAPSEIYAEFCQRCHYMSNKDKELDIAKKIEKVFNIIIESITQ